jgi:hypothetical protein
MLKFAEAVCAGDVESFTCTVKDAVPPAVGVPPIWPVALFSVSPAGRDPAVTDQLYGVVPPLAANVAA